MIRRVLRRTAQIGCHEQTIAILQSRKMIEEEADDTMILSTKDHGEEMTRIIAERDEESANCARLETELSQAMFPMAAIEADLAQTREQSNQYLSQIERLTSELETNQLSITHLSATLQDSQTALESALSQQVDLQSTHDQLIASFDSTSLLYHSTLAEVARVESSLRHEAHDRADLTSSTNLDIVTALEEQLQLSTAQLVDVTSRLESENIRSTSITQSMLDAEVQLQAAQFTIDESSRQVAKGMAELQDRQTMIESMQLAYDGLLVEGENQKLMIDASEGNKSTLLMELNETRSERDLLLERIDGLERELNASQTLSASVRLLCSLPVCD